MCDILMSEFKPIWDGLDWSVLTNALLSIIPALICITFHELSHGLVAYALGDNTAKRAGRLTLNPIRHIDIMGLISMAFLGFGWAKPVPVDMRKFKNPKTGMALVALAGPASNLILAVIVLLLSTLMVKNAYTSDMWMEAWSVMQRMAYLSIALAIFNIIPIPPLDGSKVLFSFLSENMYYKLMRYERYGMIILLIVLWSGVFDTYMGGAAKHVYETLYNWVYGLYGTVVGL